MRKNLKTMILAALCGSTALGAVPPEALAGPMGVAPPSVVSLDSLTTDVHYRRYYHRHYRHWGYRPYHRHWRHRHWGYYRPYYRRAYYGGYYGYPRYGYGYDPAGAIFASAALGLMGAGIAAATAPRWGYGWGGWGGGWGPGWGWGGGWGPGFGWGGWW
jgi:hypothetical protein